MTMTIVTERGRQQLYSVGHLVFWVVWGMGAGFLAAIFVFKTS